MVIGQPMSLLIWNIVAVRQPKSLLLWTFVVAGNVYFTDSCSPRTHFNKPHF